VRRSVGSALVTLVLLVASSASASHTSTASDIRIGVLSECGGIFDFSYQLTLAGAELALLERGARLAGANPSDGVDDAFVDGHRVSLSFGCDDGTATSALVEARRLVEADHADILIGPLGGDEELALQDYARRHPHTTFVNGSGSAQVLDPASNFFSFHPDGAAWMAGLGSYAYNQLGWRTAVTISDTFDLFNWDQTAGFTAEFCSLGGQIAKRISIPNGTTDYSGSIAKVPHEGVDGFMFATTPDVVLALGQTLPGVRRDASRRMVLGTMSMLDSRIGKLGKGARGLVTGGPFYGRFPKYIARYRRTFPKTAPGLAGGPFDLFYYGAMKATLHGLAAVHGDLSGGGAAFRTALGQVVLDAPNGRFSLDRRHRASGTNLVLALQWPTQQLRVIRKIDNAETTYGGYFRPTDPPPSRTTPTCVKRTPPPWAR
jgi:branched-chain amino acid transport system substrate-binding protein